MNLEDMLKGYAVESGVIAPQSEPSFSDGDVVKSAGELLQEEAYCKHEETLTDKLDHAEKAREIADQLDELADKAEDLAGEDHAYARNEVAIESLHREFRGLMRAHRLSFAASSFEHAYGDIEQLQGLAKDARRTSQVVRGYRRDILDYSSEGSIMKFLMGSQSKLEKAQASLRQAQTAFKAHKASVSEGLVIKNDGMALFMNQGGQPVTDLKKAVEHDAAWLEGAHTIAVDFVAAVLSAAGKVKPGVSVEIPSLDKKKVATAVGALLGNRTVDNDLDYRDEHKRLPNGKVAAAAVGGLAGSFYVANKLAMGAVMSIGGPVGVAAAVAGAASIGHLTGRAINAYNEHEHNKSEIKSIASADDLDQIAKMVLGFDRYLKFSLDMTSIDRAVKQLAEVDKTAADNFDSAIAVAADVVEVIYEHAHFVTLNIAHLLELAVSADKK